jgi:DNA-binding transcriptional LysR family regulator|uniref:LysR family transcriptional regulator n=1 Tax=uncultured Acidovorax sp. TaxID=158751 RepID=UPI000B002F1B|nr:LysR family transcriptional regulator [uncultured Acidovorax sp.]
MRDIRFEDMHLFARVADLGSLSAVARERDAPVSQVSRTLARIEQSCGARLVHRSTHGLTLTAEGQTFLDYCRRITGVLDELEGEFAQQSSQPSGWVRVASSSVVAEYLLIPSFDSLQQQHPQLRVELVVDDRMADMARDGIDIAIRTGPPLTDTVVARPLGTLARALYATPGYLQAHGVPQQPGDLRQHRLIANSAVAFLNHWPFLVDGVPEVLVAEGHWRSGSTAITARLACRAWALRDWPPWWPIPSCARACWRPCWPTAWTCSPRPSTPSPLRAGTGCPKFRPASTTGRRGFLHKPAVLDTHDAF